MNGYELLAQFEKEIKECFTVPNNLLPEEFQDNRMVYEQVSLATLERKCDERDKIKSISAEQEDSIERKTCADIQGAARTNRRDRVSPYHLGS